MKILAIDDEPKAAKARIRLILHDLRATLRQIGMEDILIRERRQLGGASVDIVD